MATYFYEKWSKLEQYVSRRTGGSESVVSEGYTVVGYGSVTVDPQYGVYNFINYPKEAKAGISGTSVYVKVSDTEYKMQGFFKSGSTYYLQSDTYKLFFETTGPRDYIETVAAADGAYPANGTSGSYWYIKKGLAEMPTLTSPNGGESWNESHAINWDESASGLRHQIQLSTNNGSSWQTLATTSAGATSYTYDFSNISPTSIAKMRIRAYDNKAYGPWDESDGVFTIVHNVAPATPSIARPKNGDIADRTTVVRFEWAHNDGNANDVQSKADVNFRKQGASLWETRQVNSRYEYYNFNTNTFDVGVYEWRVRTYDQAGLVSPWSDVAVFSAADPTNAPDILTPGDVVNVSRPVIEWSAVEQIAYRITITDGVGVATWDSGEVNSTVRAVTAGATLVNGGTYTLSLRVKGEGGIFSATDTQNFVVSYTEPAQPLVDVENGGHYIKLLFDNPEPQGTQPAVVRHEVFRRRSDELPWMRIGFDVNGSFTDYSTASGAVTAYYIRAWGDNGTFRDSLTVEGVTLIEHAELLLISSPTERVVLEYNTSVSQSKSYERTLTRFAGRKYPLAEFSPEEGLALSTDYILKDRESLLALYALLDRKETMLYRDREGRYAYVTIGGISEDEIGFGELYGVSFQMDQVYVKEEV